MAEYDISGLNDHYWTSGGCGEYACALQDQNPALKLGRHVEYDDPAEWEDDYKGFVTNHVFAHDDTHAYDALGKHPLPYAPDTRMADNQRLLDTQYNVPRLDIEGEWNIDPEMIEQAHHHINETHHTSAKIPDDFRSLLDPGVDHENYDGPLMWLWVFDPISNKVHLEHNEGKHPALRMVHKDFYPEIKDEASVRGFVYKIKGGWRVTDRESREVQDQYVVSKVLAAIKGEKQEQPQTHPRYHGMPI